MADHLLQYALSDDPSSDSSSQSKHDPKFEMQETIAFIRNVTKNKEKPLHRKSRK